MADEEKQETENQEKPKGGKPWLLIVLASLISIALGAGATFFLVGSKAAPVAAEDAAKAEAGANGSQASFSARVFDLDPFVVNVTGEGYPRYLKLQVAFEMDSLSARERMPSSRSASLIAPRTP